MGLQFLRTQLVPITAGQRWRHKRDRGRVVEITGLGADIGEPYRYAQVKRNTSRRTQPIRFDTLRRDYELIVAD